MKRSKNLAALLLALLTLINVMCVTAFAAGESPVLLSASKDAVSGAIVQVDVLANDAGIADGKLVITYDAKALSFVSLTAADAWNDQSAVAYSVNHSAGKITVAFASADAAAKDKAVFAISFIALAEGETVVAVNGAESYITGIETVADAAETVKVLPGADILYGDVNGDGRVTTRDVIVLLEMIAAQTTGELTSQQTAAADVNLNGKIDTRDAITILRAVAAKIPVIPGANTNR